MRQISQTQPVCPYGIWKVRSRGCSCEMTWNLKLKQGQATGAGAQHLDGRCGLTRVSVDQLRSRGMITGSPCRQEAADFATQALLRRGGCGSAVQLRLDPFAHQSNALVRIEEVAPSGKRVNDRV
jgi:hypothetical protein